jgi:hypothetical protein
MVVPIAITKLFHKGPVSTIAKPGISLIVLAAKEEHSRNSVIQVTVDMGAPDQMKQSKDGLATPY